MTESASCDTRLSIPSRLDHVGLAVETLKVFCRRLPLESTQLSQICLATTEGMNNAIEHAYRLSPEHQVELHCTFQDQQFTITISDNGHNLYAKRNETDPNLPQLNVTLDELPEGGWGRALMYHLMDEVDYYSNEAGNHLHLKKSLEAITMTSTAESYDTTIEIPSKLDHVALAGDALKAFTHEMGLPENVTGELELALVEGINNAIEHAYQFEETHKVRIRFLYAENTLNLIINDTGKSFADSEGHKLDVDLPEIGDSLDDLPEGGWGLSLMHQLMDKVEYYQTPEGNHLKLTKNL